MHLSKEFGYTYKVIEEDGFKIMKINIGLKEIAQKIFFYLYLKDLGVFQKSIQG